MAVFCRPRGVPPMTAFSKNAGHLEICPHPQHPKSAPAARRTPARLTTSGRQILSFSCRFTSRIPTPRPARIAPLRATLEQAAAVQISIFRTGGGGASSPETRAKIIESIPELSTRMPRISLRSRRLGIDPRRFGLGSGSGQVREILSRWA